VLNDQTTDQTTEQTTPLLFDLAAGVGQALHDHALVLATAESCTGGGVAEAITDISGSTNWFDCGFVVYSNASKTELLEVPDALIAQFGTVCFGWATKDGVHTERLVFSGDRQAVRAQSVRHALQGLLRFIA
jgi:nicotinamide-nucleotide amidase